ncbi:MAG: hypothetical protein ACD_54C00910G0002 [uncultured bacterium]|nr:MAG: hypothetical protein ACD_54C00910G0002 [uncultured bacterium]
MVTLDAEIAFQLVFRHFHHFRGFLDDLGHRFTRQLGDFAFQIPHPGFPRIGADHLGQRGVGDAEFTLLQGMTGNLLRHQMALGDFALFILGIARQRNDLHPVKQRPRHVVAVGRGDEHHVRQIVFNLHIVVDEGGVLFRVQHLKHRAGRITAEILPHLVNFIQQDQRVGGFRLLQRLNDLARHRADIGPPVATDLRFVAHAAQRNPNELAPGCLRNRPPEAGFTHTRRPDEAQDRPLQLGRARLHRQIFDDAFLDLFQTIVIGIQHLLRRSQIFLDAGRHPPRHAQQPIQIVAHNGRFRAHRAHGFQLFQLTLGLVARLFREFGRLDPRFKFGQLVLAILAVAQLLLNGLHLLIQIIFALGALHLAFHPGLDLLFDLQHRHFALHLAIDLFQPLGDVQGFQQVLLQRHIHAQMPRDQIGQTVRLTRFRNGRQRLFGDIFLDLGVAFEFLRHRAQHRIGAGLVAGHFFKPFGAGFKEAGVFDKLGDLHPRLAFDQHLDGAIRQFQQLQHIGKHANRVDAIGGRVIDGRVNLARQQDLLVVRHNLFQRPHRFLAANEQRHDHMREDHDIPQRQNRVTRGEGVVHVRILIWQEDLGPDPTAARQPSPSASYLGVRG